MIEIICKEDLYTYNVYHNTKAFFAAESVSQKVDPESEYVLHISFSDGNVIKTYSPTVHNEITTITQSSWDAIHSGMKMVVETHEQFEELGVESAGKTGTAQQVKTRPNHALYVGYAPYDNPEISIACRIAYGYSSSNTADVAASVYKYYFDLEDKEILLDHQADDGDSATNSFND